MNRAARLSAARLSAAISVMVVFGIVVLHAGGQDTSTKKRAKTALLLKQQESAVSDFVSENHAELAPLLESLKTHSPQQYSRAVRDLHRVQQRLASMRERDVDRHELELKIWQAKSRAQLLAAQLAVSDDESLHEQLEKLVAQHLKFRGQLMRRDRRRQQERLKKLNEQIEQLAAPETLEREVETLVRAVRRGAQKPRDTKTTSRNDKTSKNGSAVKPPKK